MTRSTLGKLAVHESVAPDNHEVTITGVRRSLLAFDHLPKVSFRNMPVVLIKDALILQPRSQYIDILVVVAIVESEVELPAVAALAQVQLRLPLACGM